MKIISDYEHQRVIFNLRPLEIKQHLINAHGIIPNTARKGYEREVWANQHEIAHKP